MKRKTNGFSLIELMIVVVIIGILATIAYPSYTRWVTETRRSDAQGALMDLAARQERYFSQCNSYTTDMTGPVTDCTAAAPTGGGLGYVSSPALTPDRHYSLSIATATVACPISRCYSAVADPTNSATTGQQKTDGRLRILSTGERFWDRNNDGTFASTENAWKAR